MSVKLTNGANIQVWFVTSVLGEGGAWEKSEKSILLSESIECLFAGEAADASALET